jgi:hypothetical protein
MYYWEAAMMKNTERHKRVIKASRRAAQLYIDSSKSSTMVRNIIIKTLDKYFDNKDVLDRYSTTVLVSEIINVNKILLDNELKQIFETSINIHRMSKATHLSEFNEICFNWNNEVLVGIEKHWTFGYSEREKNSLMIDEFALECFNNISEITEALIKPLLKEILCHMKNRNNQGIQFDDIKKMDIGLVIDELIRQGIPDIIVKVSDIKLNNWRNIGYHHEYEVNGDNINYIYGRNVIKTGTVKREELCIILKKIYDIYVALRTAFTICYVDNINDIGKLDNTIKPVREEATLISYFSMLAAQGYTVFDYENTEEKAVIVLEDVNDYREKESLYHASQFLFSLWYFTKSRELVIKCKQADGRIIMTFKCNDDLCKSYYNREIQFEDIAERMQIEPGVRCGVHLVDKWI